MKRTASQKALKAYFDRGTGYSRAELSRLIGAKPPSVGAWADGSERPKPHYRKALARLINVAEDGWMTDSERLIAYGKCESEPPPPLSKTGTDDQ